MNGKASALMVVGILLISAFPVWGMTGTVVAQSQDTPQLSSDGSRQQNNYSIEQAISDQAQLNTLAFDGLGFITGDLYSDSFLPPGKVADYFGFQYLRDVTPNGNGHNTSFVTKIANNLLATLNPTQKAKLLDLANKQNANVSKFAMDRYPLMVAFRRNMDGDIPSGSSGLSREAVMAYSAELYELDANISIERAQLYADTINSLNASQKQFLDGMVAGGFDSWADIPDQVDKKNWSKEVCVLVMTYASEMFGWYAGDLDADTYFCPERQADYFGGFFIKDAPAVGNPGYKINESMTGEKGQKFLDTLDATQRAIITGLVDKQRGDLKGIVEKRKAISVELRVALAGGSINMTKAKQLARSYGRLDGEISYFYAMAFAKVNSTLTSQQRATLMVLRDLANFTSQPTKIFLYSDLIDRPAIRNTDFLFMIGRAIPDTGQTASYTTTFGEDSDYSINPPSFKDNGDNTVSDLVTGLDWQKTSGGEMTWEGAKTYALNLVLGGHDDWRLPTSFELFNLMDHGRRSPAINGTFSVTGAEYFWSSAAEMDDAGKVWSANTGGGIGPHPKNETVSAGGTKAFHVLCVRGGDASTDLNYGLDNTGDGTVSDDSTGLMWQQATVTGKTWVQALGYCENLTLGGYSDWRLPNVKELRSISNDSRSKPSVDTGMFPGTVSEKYWSSTTEINDQTRAWYVDFAYGLVSYEAKTATLAVRAVRGGGGPVNTTTPTQPTHNPPVITATARTPLQPKETDVVHVTTHVKADSATPAVKLSYQTSQSSRDLTETTVFYETMGTVEVKPWTGNGSDNQWTIHAVNKDNIEQRKEANLGPGNPCGMEFGTGTHNLNDTMVETTYGIDTRGNASTIEFHLWADALNSTDGWAFQLDSGSGYVTRLSELTGSNHGWNKYHYELQAGERVQSLKMRFQFRASAQGQRIRVDLISVNVTGSVASGWTNVAMADDGAHNDGTAGDGTYGADIPAFPNWTTVKYYITAADGSLSAKDPASAPGATFSYSIVGSNATTNNLPTVKISEPAEGATLRGQVTIKGTAADIDAGDAVKVYVMIDDGKWTEATGGLSWTMPWDTTKATNAEHTITVRANDGKANSTLASVKVKVDNTHTLSLKAFKPKDNPTINETQSMTFSLEAVDNLKHVPTYSWSVDGVAQPGAANSFEYKTGYNDSGAHKIKVTVKGPQGTCNLTAEHEWTVTVLNMNRAPTGAIALPLDGASLKTGSSVKFKATGSDPDGQNLTYSWDFGDGQQANGQEVTHKYTKKGTYTVSMKVSDGTSQYNATISVKVAESGTHVGSNISSLLVPILIITIVALVVVILALVLRGGKAEKATEPEAQPRTRKAPRPKEP